MINDIIPFNKLGVAGNELIYMEKAVKSGQIAGDGLYTKKAQSILEKQLLVSGRVLLTTSCTHALEMAAILLDIEAGDEVIIPAYTFVSSALAFVMHNAIPIFADIRSDTLNIDETKIESLITLKTRAIVVVHYAGVACEMDAIMEIANKNNLVVIEDNAHGLYGRYKGQFLGTIGQLATQSFHESKNISCGEGGALVINDSQYLERAEIIREKGTNRTDFFRGVVDKYTWVDKGSSYVISDILAAFLTAQLLNAETFQKQRKDIWNRYYSEFEFWASDNDIFLPFVPEECEQSYHMFFLLMPSLAIRSKFIRYLKSNNIIAVFHYLPLDDSKMGQKFLEQQRDDCNVSRDMAGRIVRLPFFYALTQEEQEYIIEKIMDFDVRKIYD